MKYKGEFWAMPKEIMAMKNLTIEARVIFSILYTRANGENVSWPGQERLASDLGVGERSVRRYIEELVEGGLVSREKQGMGRTNRYTIMWGQIDPSREANLASPEGPPLASQVRPLLAPLSKRTEKKNSSKGEGSAPPSPNEFFESEEKQNDAVSWLLKKGMPEEIAREEVDKFVRYWTETSKSGLRQRWEAQQFFDIRRRFATWIKRVETDYKRGYRGNQKVAFMN